MNRKYGLSIYLTDEELEYFVKLKRLDITDKDIVPINKQVQLLLFYTKPVLFVSKFTNIDAFTRSVNKYKQMLKRSKVDLSTQGVKYGKNNKGSSITT